MILILFLTLIVFVHSFNCASLKRRSPVFDGILHLGDCNRKPVDYCNSLVENSMCNPQKNECFCKHGFVAIQEEEKVVCRTLLTELYCRVDSDCVHVDGSVCHPGAGKCVCPSGKIYVPQLHACLDIGEECDPVNRTCKAQMAMCLPARRGHSLAQYSGRCSCPEITVAVYQPNLGYHECFTRIPKPQLSTGSNQDILNPECTGCHAVEGVCYDMNDDGIGDGCRCPVDRAHSSTVDSESQAYESPKKHHHQSSLSSPCTRKQVFSSCTEESLTVCYVPHNDDQQISLSNQLQANQCSVHLLASTNWEPQFPDKTCQLTVRNNDPVQFQQWNLFDHLVARYCIQMDFPSQKSNSCGLTVMRHGKCSNKADNQVVTFAGQLYIHAERSTCRRPIEHHIPFTCLAEVPCQKPEFLRAVTMKSAQPRLQLRVLNEQNLTIDSLVVGELIRLEVVSVDDKYPAYPITIDYCAAVSYHNHGRRLSENHVHRFIRKVIWETRCKKNGLLTPFLSDVKWVELDPTIWSTRGLSATPHRSRSLTAFRVIPEETRVTITCAVRYCLVQDCIPIQNVSTFCSRAMTEFYDQQFHLLTTMLSVKKPVQSTVSCRLISCITVSQLLLGCMVMLFLDLIVFSLLVWSYRHKLIWRLKPTPKSELQPRGDSGIIPELSMSSTAQNDLFDSCLIGQPLMGVSGHRSTEDSPTLTPQSLVVGRAVISL
ncbi:hypothetical protein CSKR_107329 [Clonorchis sinensis]|uniref:Uncharacterized protein n=1 Tax=Clonorchis sinensis TaxID=79923 RepID=A0A8T1M8U9_CLOSI|nr:hypothetical protein CSKR_107329 [Clonorchis sinensis]